MMMMADEIPLPPPLPSAPLVRYKKKPLHDNFRTPSRRMMKFSSLMCGLSPLVKNRKGSELEADSDFKPGRKRVRFDSRVVYHQIPLLDPETKAVLYYSQKEIEGFFTLKKMEQMIHLYTLKNRKNTVGLPSAPIQPVPVVSEEKVLTEVVTTVDPLSFIQEKASSLVDTFYQKSLLRISEVKA